MFTCSYFADCFSDDNRVMQESFLFLKMKQEELFHLDHQKQRTVTCTFINEYRFVNKELLIMI
jgi:hypothetical protein